MMVILLVSKRFDVKLASSSVYTVNPEYFVCILFRIFRTRQLPYENKMRTKRSKQYAIQRIPSGQRLYENFMRTKGQRSQTYANLVRTEYSGFTVVGPVTVIFADLSLILWLFYGGFV